MLKNVKTSPSGALSCVFFPILFSNGNSLFSELGEVTGKKWDKVPASFPLEHDTALEILETLPPHSLSHITKYQMRITLLKKSSTEPLTLKPACGLHSGWKCVRYHLFMAGNRILSLVYECWGWSVPMYPAVESRKTRGKCVCSKHPLAVGPTKDSW